MAKQTINIGTAANDGTGDPIRTAFDKANDNFTELYDGAGGVADGSITTAKLADDAVTTAKITDANITSAKLATDSVTTVKITDANVTTAKIADDAVTTSKIVADSVTNAKLEDRYKSEVAITTLTGTVSFDCSAGSSFKLSGDLTGAYTIDLSNYKRGQVITIFPLKAQSITLAGQGSSSNTFYKIGGVDYDSSAYNILQIECVDDSATAPIFFYSIAAYVSDSTP